MGVILWFGTFQLLVDFTVAQLTWSPLENHTDVGSTSEGEGEETGNLLPILKADVS